jgi:hypothetical protein
MSITPETRSSDKICLSWRSLNFGLFVRYNLVSVALTILSITEQCLALTDSNGKNDHLVKRSESENLFPVSSPLSFIDSNVPKLYTMPQRLPNVPQPARFQNYFLLTFISVSRRFRDRTGSVLMLTKDLCVNHGTVAASTLWRHKPCSPSEETPLFEFRKCVLSSHTKITLTS